MRKENKNTPPKCGFIKGNEKMLALLDRVKPEIKTLRETCILVATWIQHMIPKIEDGNDFGVAIQMDYRSLVHEKDEAVYSEIRVILMDIRGFYSFFALRIHSEANRPLEPQDNTDLAAPLQSHGAPCRPQGSLEWSFLSCSDDIIQYVLVQVEAPMPNLPRPRFSLYLSSQLQYGVVLVYHKQCGYLLVAVRSGPGLSQAVRVPARTNLSLPDNLSLLETYEGAMDPFFGVMEEQLELPSPLQLPQPPASLHAADSPCSRLRATASEDNAALGQLTGKPAGARPDHRGALESDFLTVSPESITLKETEPILPPRIEVRTRVHYDTFMSYEMDLPEITAQEIEMLLEQEDMFPTEEGERERERERERRRREELEDRERERGPERELEKHREALQSTESPRVELGPELDSMVLLDEVTGLPVEVPSIPAATVSVEVVLEAVEPSMAQIEISGEQIKTSQ
ncbi:UNVERIFIED_CONTAM: hypothetical protein FKN15_073334 [Acipenser sinensis]